MNKEFWISKRVESRSIDVESVTETGLRIYQNTTESAMLQIRSKTEKQGRISGVWLNRQQCLDAAQRLLEIAEELRP